MLNEVSFQSSSPLEASAAAAAESKVALAGRMKSEALMPPAAQGLQGLHGLHAPAAHGLHGLQGLHGLHALAAHGLQGLQGSTAATAFFTGSATSSTTDLLSQPASARPVASVPVTIATDNGWRRFRCLGN